MKNWWRYCIYSIPVVVLILAGLYDINVSGIRHYTYSFDRPSAVISQLFPAQRLNKIENGQQHIIDEPVYFTVRYPHSYERLSIELDVHAPEQARWSVGLRTAQDDAWAYTLKSPDMSGRIVFDLQNSYIEDRSLRFLLSLEDVGEHRSVMIDEIRITLERPPLLQWLRKKGIL